MSIETLIDEFVSNNEADLNILPSYSSKDFASDQDVRWCPGCGDYTILKQVQNAMPELGIAKKDIVFISGIGCSSRFPYYMDTFGMHSIHGRAPAIASGLKVSRPDLTVWIITGDGDSLSIGANHFVQLLRRNMNVNLLLFNNQIYGLTKGQYSPTTPEGSVFKSTPYGSIDHPFNPLALSLGADGTFVARAMDRDPKHLKEMILRSHKHQGTSMLEIYQNCIVFNDGAFELFTDKKSRPTEAIYLEHGQPLVFGKDKEKGVRLNGLMPEVVELGVNFSKDDLWVHDEQDATKAHLLSRFFEHPRNGEGVAFPRPFGVLYAVDRPCYDVEANAQIQHVKDTQSPANLDELLEGPETWLVK